MRTTLDLDPEVLKIARELASSRSISLGNMISELARRGLQSPPTRNKMRNGLRVLHREKGAELVTLEKVNRLRDE